MSKRFYGASNLRDDVERTLARHGAVSFVRRRIVVEGPRLRDEITRGRVVCLICQDVYAIYVRVVSIVNLTMAQDRGFRLKRARHVSCHVIATNVVASRRVFNRVAIRPAIQDKVCHANNSMGDSDHPGFVRRQGLSGVFLRRIGEECVADHDRPGKDLVKEMYHGVLWSGRVFVQRLAKVSVPRVVRRRTSFLRLYLCVVFRAQVEIINRHDFSLVDVPGSAVRLRVEVFFLRRFNRLLYLSSVIVPISVIARSASSVPPNSNVALLRVIGNLICRSFNLDLDDGQGSPSARVRLIALGVAPFSVIRRAVVVFRRMTQDVTRKVVQFGAWRVVLKVTSTNLCYRRAIVPRSVARRGRVTQRIFDLRDAIMRRLRGATMHHDIKDSQ